MSAITSDSTIRIDSRDIIWIDVVGLPSVMVGGGRDERREVAERVLADLRGPCGVAMAEAIKSRSPSAMVRAFRKIGA